jgi:2-C-methyl-D-erythritol 4-phosphate cytidylyltransferase
VTTAAIVLAAGSGTRMGEGPNKPYRMVAGHPLLWYSITALELAGVEHVVVVARPDDFDAAEGPVRLVAGGPTRTASEHAGLAAIEELEVDLVMIHDAARPFITPDLVRRLGEAAAEFGGAVPALPPPSPLWRRLGDRLEPASARIVRVQTPQAFRAAPLRTAYQHARGADVSGADTAEIVERFSDLQVVMVEGDPLAFKVTYRDDLARLEEAVTQWQTAVDPARPK